MVAVSLQVLNLVSLNFTMFWGHQLGPGHSYGITMLLLTNGCGFYHSPAMLIHTSLHNNMLNLYTGYSIGFGQ